MYKKFANSFSVTALFNTIISRLLLFLIMVVCALPTFIFLFLIPASYRYDCKAFYWFEHFFYVTVLKATLLPIKYTGLSHIPSNQPAIYVANHQSSLDIPLVGALMRCFPHIWLATITLMDSPILRFILPRATVLIDTSTPIKGMRSLNKAIAMITDKQRNVIIFPEGTRYTDGRVHDFYAGFVILAKKTGRPVIPIRIFGVEKVYPPEVFLMQRHTITVVIGEPLYCQEEESNEAFKDRVYQWFLEQKEP